MFANIVVGIDGSETSEKALHLACNLAGKYDSKIHIVHTPQPHTVAFAMGAVTGYHTVTTMPSTTEVDTACEKLKGAADKIALQYDRKISNMHMERGEPADQIVEFANKCAADLIITGRRGLGSVGSLLQGSTSLRVNHLAKCACLSVV